MPNSSIVIQHGCDNSTVWGDPGPGPSPARQFCSAPCWSALACAAHLHSAPMRHLWCFRFSQQKAVFGGKGNSALWARADPYRQMSPPQQPDWPILMQMRTPNPCSLVQKTPSWLIIRDPLWWLVKKLRENSCIALLDGENLSPIGWMGKVLVLLIEIKFQEHLYKGWLRWLKHSTGRQFNAGAGSLVQASPWSVVCMRDCCVEMATGPSFLKNLSPLSHQELFLVGIFFFNMYIVHTEIKTSSGILGHKHTYMNHRWKGLQGVYLSCRTILMRYR